MRNHPKAGQPVKIANGPLKGQYYLVTGYLSDQFQGKAMAGILHDHEHLVQSVKARGFPLDDDLVIGKLYPAMEVKVLHDKELQVEMHSVEGGGELPPNVESMTKRKPKAAKTLASLKKEKENEPNTPKS